MGGGRGKLRLCDRDLRFDYGEGRRTEREDIDIQ